MNVRYFIAPLVLALAVAFAALLPNASVASARGHSSPRTKAPSLATVRSEYHEAIAPLTAIYGTVGEELKLVATGATVSTGSSAMATFATACTQAAAAVRAISATTRLRAHYAVVKGALAVVAIRLLVLKEAADDYTAQATATLSLWAHTMQTAFSSYTSASKTVARDLR